MTNKTTKRALLASIVSLVLCFSMLLGTTYAWFTDSAVSKRNIIQSGNLDIVLEIGTPKAGFAGDQLADPNNWDWKEVDENTQIFKDYALYEPGYVETVALRIRNNGSLALKYNLSTVIANEKEGTNKAGEKFKLSESLKVVTAPSLSYTNYSRSILMGLAQDSISASGIGAFVGNLNENMATNAVLYAGQTNWITAAIVMPTTIGDEANHNGDAPSITIGVELVATQFTYEKDSFGNDYDTNAEYPVIEHYDYVVSDLEGLKEAFTNGGNVILTNDIEFEKITPVEPGAEVYLNLNGKTITVDESTTSNTLIWVKEGGKLTIDGNGTIDLGDVSTMAIFCPYGELVIENGTFIRNKVTTVTDDTTGLFLGSGSAQKNMKVTINGGYFDPGYYDVNAKDIEAILAGTATFAETADDIAKRGQPGDANLVRVAVKDNVSALLNHSGWGSFKVYGGTFVGANPAWGDEGCMLPTTPNYLRPWSYYQGALLDGQTFDENGIVLPDGYSITMGTTADGIPTYTVEYSK